jgi:hypothetical protein
VDERHALGGQLLDALQAGKWKTQGVVGRQSDDDEALPPTGGEHDEKASEGLARNLIYVATWRAMDNLNVFVMEEGKEKAVRELVGATDGLGTPSGVLQRNLVPLTMSAKQIFELLWAESSIRSYCPHRICVDGIMAGDGQAHVPVGHDDMLALSQDHKTGFFRARTAWCSLMPGIFGTGSDRYDPLYDGDFRIVFRLCIQPFTDR